MGIHSDGSYGIEEGLIYSFPVTCENGQYTIVQGLDVNDFSRDLMQKTEQDCVKSVMAFRICCLSISEWAVS